MDSLRGTAAPDVADRALPARRPKRVVATGVRVTDRSAVALASILAQGGRFWLRMYPPASSPVSWT